jgi:guanosine-3',5'-bis(diphosphate) 3'-pyrophosphohydrolase
VVNLLDNLLQDVKKEHPHFPLKPIQRAYELANDAHGPQLRKSGEPYIVHPIEVVRILLKMNVDLPSIVAGLLHDTVEDTLIKLDQIEKDFGKDVAFLVDGVTKLSKLSFRSKQAAQAENFRKMMIAMSRDVRVILIKLADRLHNMRTLQFMAQEKQLLIAKETEEVYAPLAHRLGINWIKTELQDLALRFTKPEVYFKLVQLVAQTRDSREKYIQEVIKIIDEKMKENEFGQYEITGRPKNFYSIYSKMEKQQLTFEQIHDLLAFRIVTEDIRSCYQALGLIHSMWKPVPGRFKDYIAMPKANLYQSLHTTVIGPKGQRVEIQIRTEDMHRIAEQGIAAHWTYKEDGSVDRKDIEKFSWVRNLVEEHESLEDASEFLHTVKVDLFEEEVFVFTPKGDVVALPKGACPIDLAYAVHSAVGSKCVGAKINGRLVPLRHQLESGDSVEILTSEGQSPRKDWLDFCVTSRARSKIRAFVKKAERDQSRELGEKLLEREFRKGKQNLQKHLKTKEFEEAARQVGAANEEDLLIKVGYGKLLASDAYKSLAKLLGLVESTTVEEARSDISSTPTRSPSSRSGSGPVIVQGMDNLLIRFARCCSPIPGEPIVGFVSRGKGISVHAASCQKALDLDPMRRFELEWDTQSAKEFQVGVRVTTVDRPGMLADITKIISEAGANISNAKVQMHSDRKANILLEVGLRGLRELQQLLIRIEKIDGVISAERAQF